MVQLSAITDGISQDPAHALAVISEAGITHCEFQEAWGSGVDDLSDGQIDKISRLLDRYGLNSACISRKLFVGLPALKTKATDLSFVAEMDRLRRCIDIAHKLGAPMVRSMSMQREAILSSRNGPSYWNNQATWQRFVELFREPVRLAEEAGIVLVVETSLTGIINSAQLGARLVEEIGSPNLKILWDPANCLYCGEDPLRDGFPALANGALGHIHIKDVQANPARGVLDCCPLGDGDMGPFLRPLAERVLESGYSGTVSIENVYWPDGGTVEDGFNASVDTFLSLFRSN